MATTPVTGYCTFHEAREIEVPWPNGTGTTLGETLVRFGSPGTRSRRCTADSRHPPPEPDDAVHRAAAVPPIRGPGWHTLAGPTGSLFFAWRIGQTRICGPTDYPEVIRRKSQSPRRGESCDTANSRRARAGTISSGRRSSHACRILAANQCGSIALIFAPPPG